MPDGFIPPRGGYTHLLSYRKAEIVYDATIYFCDRFFEKRDRTRDQMIQATRSGKQNIIEGSQASGTPKETELRLTNVARVRPLTESALRAIAEVASKNGNQPSVASCR